MKRLLLARSSPPLLAARHRRARPIRPSPPPAPAPACLPASPDAPTRPSRACRPSTTSRRRSRATSARSSGSRPTTRRRRSHGHVTFAKPGKMTGYDDDQSEGNRVVSDGDGHQGLRGQQQADVRAADRQVAVPGGAVVPHRHRASSRLVQLRALRPATQMKFPGGCVLVGTPKTADARVLEGPLLRRQGDVAGAPRDDHRRPGQPEPLRLRQRRGQRARAAGARSSSRRRPGRRSSTREARLAAELAPCPHCGALARVEPSAALRWRCAVCGGPLVPTEGGVARSNGELASLVRVAAARAMALGWIAAAFVLGAIAVMARRRRAPLWASHRTSRRPSSASLALAALVAAGVSLRRARRRDAPRRARSSTWRGSSVAGEVLARAGGRDRRPRELARDDAHGRGARRDDARAALGARAARGSRCATTRSSAYRGASRTAARGARRPERAAGMRAR